MATIYELLFLLLPLQSAGYVLKAFFHTYENPLHAYVDLLQIKLKCCKGPPPEPPCTHSCDTTLDYCFREVNTGSININTPFVDCLSPPETSGLLEDTDYIDYSTPPLTAGGNSTPTSMTQRGDTWNVGHIIIMLSHYIMYIISFTLLEFCLLLISPVSLVATNNYYNII